jgi:hypothetical protein
MGPGEIFAWIAAVLSAAASVLAWAARLFWGKEFAAAKDETIRAKEAQLATKDENIKAKEAQIAALTDRLKEEKELNPMKIREYFVSVKQQLEEYIERLKGDLTKAQGQLSTLQVEIEGERSRSAGRQDQIKKLDVEKTRLQRLTLSLQNQVDGLQVKRSESAGVIFNFDSLSKPLIVPDLASITNWQNIKLPLVSSTDWLKTYTSTTFPFSAIQESEKPEVEKPRKPEAERPKKPEPEKRKPKADSDTPPAD